MNDKESLMYLKVMMWCFHIFDVVE